MNGRRKRDRAAPLPEELRQALDHWVKTEGRIAVARQLQTTERSVTRWRSGGAIDFAWSSGGDPREALRRRLSATSTPAPSRQSAQDDVGASLRAIFDEGVRLHFELFQPQAATASLSRYVYHPLLEQVPPVELLESIATILAIYRQCLHTGDGDFIACGNRTLACIEPLAGPTQGEQFAALLCLLAWELTAVTVQRGHAESGAVVLEDVERFMEERRLWDFLPSGRRRTMARMMHVARVLSPRSIDGVGKLVGSNKDPLSRLDEEGIPPAKEWWNTFFQRQAQGMRFAPRSSRAATHLGDELDGAVRGLILDLANRTSDQQRLGLARCSDSLTPATTVGAAFQAITANALLGRGVDDELSKAAFHLASAVQQQAEGSIMLVIYNKDMRDLARVSGADRHVSARGLKTFAAVGDVSVNGALSLLRLARRSLLLAERCFPVVYATSKAHQHPMQ